jgi:chemotaxis protein MotB
MVRDARPIIIRRVQQAGAHAHHGGAWKVAYADFVTAMMAFFLLLWLISSASDETRKGLAEFFSNATVNIGPPGGIGGVLDGMTVIQSQVPPLPTSPFDRPELPTPQLDQEPVEELRVSARPSEEDAAAAANAARREEGVEFDRATAAILAALQVTPDLRQLKDSLRIEQTPEGLRIELLDRDQLPMFPNGSDVMYPHTRRLLALVAHAIVGLPNRISIRGHTDATPFQSGTGYDNWDLSTDRANEARTALVTAGLDSRRVAEVVGKGDAEPLLPDQADDPRNRRLSVVLLHIDAGPRGAVGAREMGRQRLGGRANG